MSRRTPTVVILTLLVLAGHAVGSIFTLYEEIFWFDMVMHALGGAWLAAVAFALLPARYPAIFASPPRRTFLAVVALVTVAGILWEIYEFGFAAWATAQFGDLGFHQPWTDTVSDLFLDIAGAALTALFLLREEREIARPEVVEHPELRIE